MASSKNGFFSRNCFVILVIFLLFCFKRYTTCLFKVEFSANVWAPPFRGTSCSRHRICLGHTCFIYLVSHILLLLFLLFCLFHKRWGSCEGGVCLFVLFLIRLGLSFFILFYKKPHSSKNIYDFLLFVLHLLVLLCLYWMFSEYFDWGSSFALNNTLLWLAFS